MPTRPSADQARFLATVCISVAASVLVTGLFLYALPSARPELAALLLPQHPAPAPVLALPPEATATDAGLPVDPLVAVVKRAQPAVVSISVEATASPALVRKLLSADWVDPATLGKDASKPQRVDMGGGSGFFVNADGMLVTNRHVVDNQYIKEATDVVITVTLHDGVVYHASVVASDPVLDLAFLHVDAPSPTAYLSFADSDRLDLGQSVIAIGNALDQFRNSITSGIISGLNRRVLAGDDGLDEEVIENAIQTDAAINPGNSGGPLLDLAGKVVGVNTAISDSGQSLGFALPANVVSRSLESVRRFGRVVRPFLGVRYVMVTEDVAKADGLQAGHGALVARGDKRSDLAVLPGSPADLAGLKEGDVIMAIDGREVQGDESLSSLISRFWPGDKAVLRTDRGGEERTVTITFTEMPADKP